MTWRPGLDHERFTLSDSEDLICQADALLGRYRSTTPVPLIQAAARSENDDFPVLTDVVNQNQAMGAETPRAPNATLAENIVEAERTSNGIEARLVEEVLRRLEPRLVAAIETILEQQLQRVADKLGADVQGLARNAVSFAVRDAINAYRAPLGPD